MPRRVGLLLALVTLMLGLVASAAAQEPTPSAGATDCAVESYDLTTVLVAGSTTPPALDEPDAERPTGEPAAEVTIAAVTETVELLVGCVNLGYQLKWLFLFTPEYLPIFLQEEGFGPLTEEDIQILNELAPTETSTGPLPDDQRTLILSIGDVQQLEDDRVVATVTSDNLASEAGASPRDFLFRDVDGRFLIDQVIEPDDDGTPAA